MSERGGELGSESAATQPSRWISHEWTQRLVSRKCFRVVQLWGSIAVTPALFCLGSKQTLTKPGSVHAWTTGIVRLAAVGTLRTFGPGGKLQVSGRVTGRGSPKPRGERQRKDQRKRGLGSPQRRMHVIYGDHAGRSVEGRGKQGKKRWLSIRGTTHRDRGYWLNWARACYSFRGNFPCMTRPTVIARF